METTVEQPLCEQTLVCDLCTDSPIHYTFGPSQSADKWHNGDVFPVAAMISIVLALCQGHRGKASCSTEYGQSSVLHCPLRLTVKPW